MIVLPNTPPVPRSLQAAPEQPQRSLSPDVLSLRSSFAPTSPLSNSESAQFALKLERYLEAIFDMLVAQTETAELSAMATAAQSCVLSSSIPWKNVVSGKSKVLREKCSSTWTLASEVSTVAASISFIYMRLAADVINDLIDLDATSGDVLSSDVDQKWRSVAEYYKKAISLSLFGSRFSTAVRGACDSASCDFSPQLNPTIFALTNQLGNIGIQLSMLCKAAWSNRATFSEQGKLTSHNNGVLCRVAIWVLNEVTSCQNVVQELSKSTGDVSVFNLNYEKWPKYLDIFAKYIAAYSGLFLSIEFYQKQSLGQAIGLLNYSLLSLQSKNLDSGRKKGLGKLRGRFSGRKNENFVANLQSVTSLDIDKSVFSESSGAVLNDLSLLFDQLVLLHLKMTKENDNLKFDPVTHWRDSRMDSKWPLGAKIPVSSVEEYLPSAMASVDGANESGGNSTRHYY